MDSLLGRISGGLFAHFRRMPGRLTAQDLRHLKISFSQFGEDLLILEYLQGLGLKDKGIYIDAGCFDPFLFSNTRLLNLFGWKGINIDAAKDVIGKFNHYRPNDHNICAALSDQKSEMAFIGKEGSPSRKLKQRSNAKIDEPMETVVTTTLAEILHSTSFQNMQIDFLDIDCENHDQAVLRGFPLEAMRPRLICIESHCREFTDIITQYLSDYSYSLMCARGPSLIFYI